MKGVPYEKKSIISPVSYTHLDVYKRQELINQLNQILLSEGKYDELQKASKDKEYQKKLLAEYKYGKFIPLARETPVQPRFLSLNIFIGLYFIPCGRIHHRFQLGIKLVHIRI